VADGPGPSPTRPPTAGRRWRWRWLGLAALGAALLAAGGSWWLSRQLDQARLVAMLSAEAMRQTGRQLHVDGRLALRLLPWPAVTLEGLRLANAAGGSRADMLQARSVVLEVALWPLFDRRIELRRVALSGADLLLETDARGRGNWEFTPPPARQGSAAPALPAEPGEPGAAPLVVMLQRIDIDDSRLTWRAGAGVAHTLALQSVRVEPEDGGAALDARLQLNGQALRLSGSTGALDALQAGRDFPVDLRLTMDGALLGARGSVGGRAPDSTTRLALRAEVTDLTALARASGRALAMPTGLPMPVTISADLEQRGAVTTVPAFKIDGQSVAVSGRARIDRSGRRARVDGAVQAASLDLSNPPARAGTTRPDSRADTAQPRAPSTRLFSAEPWPALNGLDADVQIEFDIARLRLAPKLELQALRGKLLLGPGRIDVDPLAFSVADGSVTGTVGLKQPPGALPTLSVDARAQGITLEALAAMAGGRGVTGGRGELRLALAGDAGSAEQFARSLRGQILLDTGAARLAGSQGSTLLGQIIEAVNPLSSRRGGSDIECVVVRLDFAGGVASFDRSVAVQTSAADVAGSGRIDLGAETLDIALLPTLRKAGLTLGQGLAPMLRLKGPLAAPKLVVDAKGAASVAAAIGAAVVTGGVSLFGQRLLGAPPDPQPCKTALTGTPQPPPAEVPPRLLHKSR